MNIEIGKQAVPTFAAGDGVAGTTPAALPGRAVSKHVVIRANAGNSGSVIIGHSLDSVASGFVLAAGNQTPPIYVDDLGKVFIVGSAAGQGFSWIVA